jgi:hypothetical protein
MHTTRTLEPRYAILFKYVRTLVLALFFAPSALAQSSEVEQLLASVSLDSLQKNVRILAGQEPAVTRDSTFWISTRWYNDNESALQFVKYTLERHGYSTTLQSFDRGTNVLATRPGTAKADRHVLICAHYDAVAGTPGADDNASGTAAVLEAARVLVPYTTGKTVTFALWDAEEIGLFGSAHYAREAAGVGKQIDAVINLDMVGWDGDGDRVVEVHTDALSASLADAVVGYAQSYSINVTPVPQNPGTGASDHASFWRSGYQAVLLIEEYYGADFNPYYHQPTDSLLHFNLEYYAEAVKLGIAATAELAEITETSTDLSPRPTDRTRPGLEVYPSPLETNVTIRYGVNVNGPATVIAFDLLGRTVAVLVDEWRNSGTHTTEWNTGHLPPGIYILRLTTGNNTSLLPVVRSN